MRTFCIQTLGCKVNQYESEQMATLLRSQGWTESDSESAELRIVNTCSVTMEAASKSRQAVRRAAKLPMAGEGNKKVVVAGCWATSDKQAAGEIPGVDLVLTHHDDVAEGLSRLSGENNPHPSTHSATNVTVFPGSTDERPSPQPSPGVPGEGERGTRDCASGVGLDGARRRLGEGGRFHKPRISDEPSATGARSLPLLNSRQNHNQRAFLKIQDGCDAHCTYCIIPKLRPLPWSKPVEDLIRESRQLVDAGHVELILTGIFLGAYGQETALRRRQSKAGRQPLAAAVEALCTRVPGLRRLRLSSLEPGDLDEELIATLRSHSQVVPHFHLPLQSGSDEILRKMNRQYTREDFLRLTDRLYSAFDRPALTTDIIVGFPGETDAAFEQTVDVADRSRFIHIHAFPFSPRPGTAAARWKKSFVRGPIVNDRIDFLRQRADEFSLGFRSAFVNQIVQVLVERERSTADHKAHHGRCERYFDIHFESEIAAPGDLAGIRIDRVTPTRTFGTLVSIAAKGPESSGQ